MEVSAKMKTCAITGHRATRFKFKYNENYAGCKRLKKRLHDQFILLYEQGVRRFLGGGCRYVEWGNPAEAEGVAGVQRH